MEEPVVSIVMPAFNAEKTISESIQSVLSQTYKYWELIIIDDASTDSTASVVTDFQKKDRRIVLLKFLKNGGLPNARNEGCRVARGEFIAFLDSDDLWHQDKLLIQINFHRKNQDIEISHTDFHLFNERGVLKRPFRHLIHRKSHKQGILYPAICYKNPIGVLTVMMKKELLREVNFFDASLWTMEDQDLWVRVALRKKRFGYIAKPLAYYRVVAGSITSKTGRYKKAYKTFMQRILDSNKLNPDLLHRYYYLHFGTVYFKKEAYKLARLYFWKSIKLVPHDHVAVYTLGYIFYDLNKQALKILTSKMKAFFRKARY